MKFFNFQELRKSPEQKREQINPEIIKNGINTALLVVDRLNVAHTKENGERPLEYHTTKHTETVVQRYNQIVSAIRRMSTMPIDEREVQIGELAAGWHDTVRSGGEVVIDEPEDSPFAGMSKLVLKDTTGANEEESEDLLVSFMDEVNKKFPETFTEQDKEISRTHIAVTIPDFDPINKTVFQPNLNETSSVPMRAIALADIGVAGMGTPEEFIEEGDAVFREENIDIAEAFASFANKGYIDERTQEYFAYRMRMWSANQEKFAEGRKNRLDEELEGLEPAIVHGLKNEVFTNFDASIAAAQKHAKERREMSFFELARDMGYSA